MNDPAADDDELRLAPDDGLTRDEVLKRAVGEGPAALPLSDEEKQRIAAAQRKPLLRFSLAEVMLLTTVLCLGLGSIAWLPPGTMAGFGGIIALALSLVMFFRTESSRGFRLAMACVLLFYLAASAMSLWRTLH